jgi:hypothetical protein
MSFFLKADKKKSKSSPQSQGYKVHLFAVNEDGPNQSSQSSCLIKETLRFVQICLLFRHN